MMSPATPSDVAARTVNPISSQRWSARERRPHWRMRRMTVATATNEPPVSSATRKDGASKDIRSHGTATTASETTAAPTAANDTVGSAGLRAGPCSICSTLRTSEPGGVVPEAINPAQGLHGDPAHFCASCPVPSLYTRNLVYALCGEIHALDLPFDGNLRPSSVHTSSLAAKSLCADR